MNESDKGKDKRTLDKLINGTYRTCDQNQMWLIPFIQGENQNIYFNFQSDVILNAIKIYNYNA